jgi:hypothetical protein
MPLINMFTHITNVVQNTNSHPAASCEEFFRLNLIKKPAQSRNRFKPKSDYTKQQTIFLKKEPASAGRLIQTATDLKNREKQIPPID